MPTTTPVVVPFTPADLAAFAQLAEDLDCSIEDVLLRAARLGVEQAKEVGLLSEPTTFTFPAEVLAEIDRRRGARSREATACALILLGAFMEDSLGSAGAQRVQATVKQARQAKQATVKPKGRPRLLCPDDAVPRLGEPLHVLAAAFGVSSPVVARWRREHDVQAQPRGPVPCPDDAVPRLREPVHKLTATFGVCATTVTRWRREHGVVVRRGARVNTEAKHPDLIALLATNSNAALATRFNLSRERIRQIRKGLALPPSKHKVWPPKAGTQYRAIYDVLAASPEGIRAEAVCDACPGSNRGYVSLVLYRWRMAGRVDQRRTRAEGYTYTLVTTSAPEPEP